MPTPTAVILVVGLTRSHIGEHMPRLRTFAQSRAIQTLEPILPAVTCSAQSTMLTGKAPRDHGIVGNGWFNREYNEVQFWKQSNALVQAQKVWETARERDSSVTTLNMFWWYNMYSNVEYSVTPRPIYKADGSKIPDCYSHPPSLRDDLQRELGAFPLFNFWGPAASIKSSRWIVDATMIAHQRTKPTLTLVYLPHLDYPLQKLGPQHPAISSELRAIDDAIGDLIEYFEARSTSVIIVSEYGIEPVDRPVHLNRTLREADLIAIREEDGLELLDAGASDAFAVADHQTAHVYVRDPERISDVGRLIENVPGVAEVLDRRRQGQFGIDHERAGDLVAIAEQGAWFTYYYWLDDRRAPDFARTVDIHRKPGYDPVELFIDPRIKAPKLTIASKLVRKKLGYRTLMDVIPLDASLVRGSHGRIDVAPETKPILVVDEPLAPESEASDLRVVRDLILRSLFNTND